MLRACRSESYNIASHAFCHCFIMTSKDSACFDKRLFDSSALVVPFHIDNCKDPGTRLIVKGTESVFHFLKNAYQAVKKDSSNVMGLHEFSVALAKREVKHLESLWLGVIENAKQTLATLEDAHQQRLAEEDSLEGDIRLTVCNKLVPGGRPAWRTTVYSKESRRKNYRAIKPRPLSYSKPFKREAARQQIKLEKAFQSLKLPILIDLTNDDES